jgi:hypothetical protein
VDRLKASSPGLLYYLLFKVLFTLGPRFSVLNDALHHVPHGGRQPVALAISPASRTWLVRKLR